MPNTSSTYANTVRGRTVSRGVAVVLAAATALALGACSKTKAPSSGSTGSGSGSGSASGSGSGSTMASADPATWTKFFCSNVDTAYKGIKSETDAFNAEPNATDNSGLQQQEVARLNKYLGLVGTEIAALQSGGAPSVPAGTSFVSDVTTAWKTFQTAVQAAVTTTNGVDPNSGSFDLSSVTGTVSSAFSTLSDDINKAIHNVNNANDPSNNPMVNAVNKNSDCSDAGF